MAYGHLAITVKNRLSGKIRCNLLINSNGDIAAAAILAQDDKIDLGQNSSNNARRYLKLHDL